MFDSPELADHLATSQSISGEALVVAEWNMNDPENIDRISNYCRPLKEDGASFEDLTDFYNYSKKDEYYCNNADIEISGTRLDDGTPTSFITKEKKREFLYSLDDCTKAHRPRSGINHATYRPGSFLAGPSFNGRPRYYMGDYNNTFKYWTSARLHKGVEKGVSLPPNNDRYLIEDVAPFVAYKDVVAANRIVVKMQTQVGPVDNGEIRTPYGVINDPLYGPENACTPRLWRIEVLRGTTWSTVKSFNADITRSDGTPIVDWDGYVELDYGLQVPERYTTSRYRGQLISDTNLPESAEDGDYYLVVENQDELGVVHIWNNADWEVFFPSYGWRLVEDYSTSGSMVSSLTNPLSFNTTGDEAYREFEYIRGIRIVVDSMNKEDCSFDLIEMSSRLVVDLTDTVTSYDVKKSLGSIDTTKIPVGQLEAGTGNVEIFDYNEAFRESNPNSIVKDRLNSNISFTFYEIVHVNGENISVPMKKMYTENKLPQYSDQVKISYELRDLYYLFENTDAPPLLLTNVSLSIAIATMLDSVGFSNYKFYSVDGVSDPIIPFFFVGPDQNVAEVLQKLSVATQSAMFFDEYNNFIVMYKEYLMPEEGVRPISLTLDGDSKGPDSQPNIQEISSDEKKVLNKGTIKYSERYIQRSTGSLAQQSFVNEDQLWVYTPALLWEVAGTDNLRSINDAVSQQSSYALGATPLASDLSSNVPRVHNGKVIDNLLDIGEAVYWLPRAAGYMYAGGEIIKFDAVEYAVQGTGNVWVTSNADYQKYMSTLPFNGKMYPTGLVRIFSEPNVRDDTGTIENGDVQEHGRGQFGTEIVAHSAGVDEYWKDNDNAKSIITKSEYLFESEKAKNLPLVYNSKTTAVSANPSYRGGIIKNFMRNVMYSESDIQTFKTPRSGSVRASALVFQGNPQGSNARDYLTYVYKSFDEPFRHAGTRMRVIGKSAAVADVETQDPIGAVPMYHSTLNGEAKVITGGSGGLVVGLNVDRNTGYYFEILALTNTNLDETFADAAEEAPHNVVFYKILSDSNTVGGNPIPVKLWGGQTEILVDSGDFVGQNRMVGEENGTVYDLNVEYKEIGGSKTKRFYLYINNTQVAVVDDYDPLPDAGGIGVFVRGKSKCMFENLYALGNNTAFNKSTNVISEGTISEAFGPNSVSSGDLNKYSMSGMVQNSFLSGLSPTGDNEFRIWYEEFGTIMRECAYFDIRYDKAFPALYAQISPVLNDSPGYAVSGFTAGSYGAKFLLFNIMDKAISLDDESGNYLRIQGVTFTQNASREYSMDDYYKDAGNLSGSALNFNNSTLKPYEIKDKYKDIKIKRMKYGVSEFSLESDYIQTQDGAADLIAWLSEKTTRPRQQIGIKLFFNPMVQLGDIVAVKYSGNSSDLVTDLSKRFVVYNIEMNRSGEGPTTTLYLSES